MCGVSADDGRGSTRGDVGAEFKGVRSGVETRRGVSILKARGGRRETPYKTSPRGPAFAARTRSYGNQRAGRTRLGVLFAHLFAKRPVAVLLYLVQIEPTERVEAASVRFDRGRLVDRFPLGQDPAARRALGLVPGEGWSRRRRRERERLEKKKTNVDATRGGSRRGATFPSTRPRRRGGDAAATRDDRSRVAGGERGGGSARCAPRGGRPRTGRARGGAEAEATDALLVLGVEVVVVRRDAVHPRAPRPGLVVVLGVRPRLGDLRHRHRADHGGGGGGGGGEGERGGETRSTRARE
jgi:hypothetical protein